MQRLPDYLAEQKISQKAFAALVGVDRSIVSRLCKGRMGPGLDLAYRIKRLTGGAVPFEAWIEAGDLPLDPAFWVEFLGSHIGEPYEIRRFFGVSEAEAIDFASGRQVPTGLLALKAFAFAPWAFMPQAEAQAKAEAAE